MDTTNIYIANILLRGPTPGGNPGTPPNRSFFPCGALCQKGFFAFLTNFTPPQKCPVSVYFAPQKVWVRRFVPRQVVPTSEFDPPSGGVSPPDPLPGGTVKGLVGPNGGGVTLVGIFSPVSRICVQRKRHWQTAKDSH